MRGLAALAAVLSWAAAARADDGTLATARFDHGAQVSSSLSAGDVLVTAFFLPMAYAYALPHHGFGPFPYAPGGYGRGERDMAFTAQAGWQAAQRGRGAEHWLARVRGANRLGWDVGASSYQRGLLRSDRRAALVSAHVTSNYLQEAGSFFELGLGFATYQEPRALWGPSAELGWEAFPRRPWALALRAQSGLLRGQGYHTLSVSTGAGWRWLGVRAGYRVFLSPRGDAYGPELSAGGWF